MGRRVFALAGLVAAVVVLASCGVGVTLDASQVTDTGARLTGRVHNTEVGPTDHWFEYGPTTEYGSTTPTRTVTVDDTEVGVPVSADVSGLGEGTTYHYRLCATDADGHGVCGEDRTFATTSGSDSVTGTGIVFSFSTLGYIYGARVHVVAGADGSSPVGEAALSPSTAYFRLADTGAVTCVRVSGNRASIGLLGSPFPGDPTFPPVPRLFFVEDNGPTGDRLAVGSIDAPATDCPEPTADDFVPVFISGFPVGPELESGDFSIHDHPE